MNLKIKATLLLSFFLLHSVITESVVADPVPHLNEAGVHRARQYNDTTIITLPSDALRQTEDGRLILNSDGGNDEEPGNDWKKPRHFFIGEGAISPSDTENWVEQALIGVARLLEMPMSKAEIKEQQEHLDELERMLEAHRMQQEEKEFIDILKIESEEEIGLRNHLGFQKNHPAHPERQYSVPGVVELPFGRKKKKSVPRSVADVSGEKKERGSRVRNSDSSQGEGKQRRGGPNQPSGNSGQKEQGASATRKDYFVKEVLNGENSCKFQCEINDQTKFYQCLVCLEFVKWTGTQVDTCSRCNQRYCAECFNNLIIKSCPNCREVNMVRLGVTDINALKWQCQECDQKNVTIPDMEAHVAVCQKVASCEYDGCNFSGAQQELEMHQSECTYRPVKIGCYTFPQYLAEFIQNSASEIPDNMATESWPAGAAVTLLLEKMTCEPFESENVAEEEQSLVRRCPGCDDFFQVVEFENHLQCCKRVSVFCHYCDLGMLRGELDTHWQSSCESNTEPCVNCDRMICVKDMDRHHLQECLRRMTVCKLCNKEMAMDDSWSHSEVCRKEMIHFGAKSPRIPGTEYPAYRSNCLVGAPFTLIYIPVERLRDTGEIYVGELTPERRRNPGCMRIFCTRGSGKSSLAVQVDSKECWDAGKGEKVLCMNGIGQRTLFSFGLTDNANPTYETSGDLPLPESGWVIIGIRAYLCR